MKIFNINPKNKMVDNDQKISVNVNIEQLKMILYSLEHTRDSVKPLPIMYNKYNELLMFLKEKK